MAAVDPAGDSMDERLALLRQWAAAELQQDDLGIEPASEDASFRRYFRITLADGATLVAMDAPPEHEDCAPYVRIAGMLRTLGVSAPDVVACDMGRGFLLLTDLGATTCLSALREGAQPEPLYASALQALVRIQLAPAAMRETLPPYDEALLRREMELFREWLLGRHLGLDLSPAEAQALDAVFDLLVASALEQPRVFVHRDYHSRNLMYRAGAPVGVLDFQDAVVGPVTYDLVSLLRDCYIAWPQDQVERWLRDHFAMAQAAGVDVGGDLGQFRRWFELMGVQRHLKAAGIFARLFHRDGKAGYLGDIPRTLAYIARAASSVPELSALLELLSARVVPALGARAAPGEAAAS